MSAAKRKAPAKARKGKGRPAKPRKKIAFTPPEQQIEFAAALKLVRDVYLQDALLKTVRGMDIAALDRVLAQYVSKADLATIASFGLRAELLFAVPPVLEANPYLLGYYRLLMGYSQKEFYGSGNKFGVAHFKSMEDNGRPTSRVLADLPDLCAAFCQSASAILAGIGAMRVSKELLDDLTLLTYGPQLRGGANNRRGSAGTLQVFAIIKDIVALATTKVSGTTIQVNNAAGRRVMIEFSPDPDIVIREELAPQSFRNVVAIEVKAGTDVSNVHNRVGEAEKSHQKARQDGFTERWTIINIPGLNMAKLRSESPSTDRFYVLSELAKGTGNEYADFHQRVIALTGIPALQPPPP